MKRGRKPETKKQRERRLAWTEAILESGPCYLATHLPDPCDGPMEAAHIIRKSFLKTHVSTLPEDDRLDCIWDLRNGIPLCRLHHDQMDSKEVRVREWLPESVFSFAGEWHIAYRLDMDYPE